MGVIYSLLGWNDNGVPDPITGLTSAENKLLQASWTKLMENSLENGTAIMMSFFNKYPEHKKLFPFSEVPMDKLADDVRFKVHCNVIMYNLSQIIDNLGNTELVIGMLDKLASNHKKRAVSPKGFHDIEGIILDTIQPKVSKEAYDAWKKLLDVAMAHISKQLT